MTQRVWLGTSVFLLALVTHLNSLGGDFHYDDLHSIVENYHVRSLAEIPGYFADPATFSSEPSMAMYRPVVLTTYALAYALAGYLAWPYLLFNMVVHGVVAVLVYLLISAKLGRLMPAWWAGALFAVHPVHTQVVNYISSRSESLAILGVFAALYWLGQGKSTRGMAAYILALLSKSIALVCPPLLFLWAEKKPPPRIWVPLAALSGLYLVLISANQFLTRSLAQDLRSHGVQLYTQIKALVYYLYLIVVPARLSIEHPLDESESIAEGPVLFAALLILSLLYWIWKGRASAPALGFGVFCLGLAIPFLVPLNVLVNEHRVYLASFGLLYALVGIWKPNRSAALGASWGLLIVLMLLTWQRNEVWRDEFSLWSDAASKAPKKFRVLSNLGLAHYERGELEQARNGLEHALAINSGYARTWSNLGLVYEGLGDYPGAERAYRRALDLRPDLVGIRANLGRHYLGLGRYGAAIEELELALDLDADAVGARTSLGLAHQRAGRLEEAVHEYERVLRSGPLTVEAYNNLGLAYQDLGRLDAAEKILERALELAPENQDTAINLQMLRLRRKGLDVVEIYSDLTDRFPQRLELWRRLASQYAAAGRIEEAIDACRRILAIDPRDRQAQVNLRKLRQDPRLK